MRVSTLYSAYACVLAAWAGHDAANKNWLSVAIYTFMVLIWLHLANQASRVEAREAEVKGIHAALSKDKDT